MFDIFWTVIMFETYLLKLSDWEIWPIGGPFEHSFDGCRRILGLPLCVPPWPGSLSMLDSGRWRVQIDTFFLSRDLPSSKMNHHFSNGGNDFQGIYEIRVYCIHIYIYTYLYIYNIYIDLATYTPTIDGRNPKQPPGMYRTERKEWDIYHVHWWFARFLNHQQYQGRFLAAGRSTWCLSIASMGRTIYVPILIP